VITANLNWAMLCAQDEKLRSISEHADLVTADGFPPVWLSKRTSCPLPERVAGSDLVPTLCANAVAQNRRIFFLGAGEGVGQRAADKLRAQHPGIQIVGVEAPHLGKLSPAEHAALIERIRSAEPDLLFAAFGQPKGEVWLAANLPALGPVVAMQVGATLDFVAGEVSRAPRVVQKLHLEWLYRAALEPRRLAGRYAANLWFLLRHLLNREPQKESCRDSII
jgi:N-acetylglucosaminyldiphosphoundecaprenol N-acetyl-beta-D-mannosaminyltransferase